MLLSIGLISLLSLGIVSTENVENNDFLVEEIVEARETYSSTFLTSRNTYLSFYYGTPINGIDSIANNDESIPLDRYSGTSYIQNKYFEIGSSSTYSTNLQVGKSPLLDENGNHPVYQTVYGLTLPSIDLSYYTIRSAGLCLKKQSGYLNSVLSYKVNSPSYSNINGLSSNSLSYAGVVSLSSSFSTVDITDEVHDILLSSVSNELNILLLSNENNKTCYLYGVDASGINAPYFFIEYDNFGNARDYYEPSSSVNCYGYSLYMNSGRDIDSNLMSAFGTTDVYYGGNINPDVIDALETILINDGCTNVESISSYNSLINSNQRRIAFRMKLANLNGQGTQKKYDGGYHFMWQCSEGGWAEKSGFLNGQYGYYSNVNKPDSNSGWPSVYSMCPTYYFAVTKS